MAVQRSVYICPQCKTRIPFGTETESPPRKCPGCERRLYIPTSFSPDSLIEIICPNCATKHASVRWQGQERVPFPCRKCGSQITPPTDPS